MITRRITWLRRAAVSAAVVLGALAGAAPALGAGITLDRTPSPPQAVKLGTPQQFNFQISFTSQPVRYQLDVIDPAGTSTLVSAQNLNLAPSPFSGTASWTPLFTDAVGRWTARLQFFSTNGGSPESTATATFDVAAELGTLTISKYEDSNGNGIRDAGEPGVPGWHFNLVNPQGNGASATTGADGVVTLPNVPAGTWTVTEEVQPGWAAITPVSGTVIVPPNGTGSFAAGNVRPAPISGTVWVDVNENGRIDTGEVGRPGVLVTLTGTDGLGRAVTAQSTTTTQTGTYQFPSLLPGRYTVSATTPVGFRATTPTTIPNIPMTSAVPSPNHNVGIVPGTTVTARGTPNATPGIAITKTGPIAARRGQIVTYRIKVRNTTTRTLRNVVLRDPVPDSMTLLGTPAGATIDNGVVVWKLGTMAGGATKTVSLRVRINSSAALGNHTNVATVTATGLSPRQGRTTLRVTGPRRIPRSGAVTG